MIPQPSLTTEALEDALHKIPITPNSVIVHPQAATFLKNTIQEIEERRERVRAGGGKHVLESHSINRTDRLRAAANYTQSARRKARRLLKAKSRAGEYVYSGNSITEKTPGYLAGKREHEALRLANKRAQLTEG